MLNISSACLKALYNDAVQAIQIHVAPLRGSAFDITERDIVQGGFSYDNFLVSDDVLQVGSMTAAEINITLENADGRFDRILFAGAVLTVRLRILLESGQYEPIPLGVYTVNEQPRSGSALALTAYDNIMLLDVPFDKNAFANGLVSERDIVRTGISACGLHCNDYTMFRDVSDVSPSLIQSESSITWRQVIMWCCQLNCVNGVADENGDIAFKFYEKYVPSPLQTEAGESLETEYGDLLLVEEVVKNDFPITEADRYMDQSSFDEEDCVITGHRFKDGDEKYPADANMDYCLQSENNLVWLASEQKEEKAAAVNAAIAGFTYFPYQCSITPLPHLQLMDSIDYVREGVHHHSIITNIQFVLNGGMAIAAKAKSKVQKGWASVGALTPGQQAIIDRLSKRVTKTHAQLSDYENALLLFNERMFNAMGLYKTIETPQDGGMIVYFHDKPLLEESATIYMFSTSGFAWTTDGWNDGKPVWHYGFTDNGEAILNTIQAYVISAELIKTGRLQSQNGASWIDMDDGTFCFRAIKEAWMDTDTGEMTYEYQTVLELANKVLNVFGTLRSTQYPNYSVSIGTSENGNTGAFTVTDKGEGYGDIFQTYVVVSGNEKGCIWTAPFTLNAGETNRKGISVWPNEISIFNDANGKNAHLNITTDDFELTNGVLFVGSRHASFQINSNFSGDLFFNFYKPTEGYQVNKYVFCQGTDSGADKADIWCGAIEASGSIVSNDGITSKGQIYAAGSIFTDGGLDAKGNLNTLKKLTVSTGNFIYDEQCASFGGNVSIGAGYFPGYMFSVLGQAKAHAWVVASERNEKENIIEKSNVTAIEGIKSLRFYSYDYKPNEVTQNSKAKNTEATVQTVQLNSSATVEAEESEKTPVHVELGIMTDEAPEEILGDDGKGINLYAYTSYVAKAVQEIIDKCEKQEQRIADLEAELQALKNEKST